MDLINKVQKANEENKKSPELNFNKTAERQWEICQEMNAGKAMAIARNNKRKPVAFSIAVVEPELVDILWPLIENTIEEYDSKETDGDSTEQTQIELP